MPGLKLAKLPERTPIKIAISVTPELHRSLDKYAECYREAYGATEKVGDLIPFMLEAFLASDKDFAKTRKSVDAKSENEGQPR